LLPPYPAHGMCCTGSNQLCEYWGTEKPQNQVNTNLDQRRKKTCPEDEA